MTEVGLVSSVRERIELLITDGITWEKSFKKQVHHLNSKLAVIEDLLKEGQIDSEDLEIQAIQQLARDIENTVEYLAWQQCSSSSKLKLLWRFKGLFEFPSVKNTLQKLNGRIDELIEPYGGDEFAILKHLLLNNNNDRSSFGGNVISICGDGGVGKTSLAGKLFEDPLLVSHFDSRVWAHVGQNFQATDIAEIMLEDISREEIQRMTNVELMEWFYNAKNEKKYLLVLDDVWSTKCWDALQLALPSNKGTKIIITTRHMDVAKHVKGHIHKMELLNENHSRELLKIHSRVNYPVGRHVNPETGNIWKTLARMFCGIPLAIILIGAILRSKRLDLGEALHALEDYENYCLKYMGKRRLQDYQNGFTTLRNAEYLSYKHLPFQLKPCFLYLGCLPRGLLPVEKFYLLWMAEGFVSLADQGLQKRMDTVKGYLLELHKRGLVKLQYEDFSSDQTLKSCELHDEISDFCVSMGHREGFSESRIIVYLDTYESDNSLIISQPEHIRSLIFIGMDRPTSQSKWPAQVSDLKKFRSARVLDFNLVDFKIFNLLKGIEKLVFVRHISFRGCYLDELPSFSQLPYLETLDLRVIPSCKMIIPNVVWKMSSLRHLYFPESFQSVTGEKLKLGGLKKLEILENFHAGICDADDLPTLRNLQILTVVVECNSKDLKKCIKVIHGNDQLYHSSVDIRNFSVYSKERFQILQTVFSCDPLHVLKMDGPIPALPPHEVFGLNLSEMVLKRSGLKKDPMPILGKLQNLRRLVLYTDAFYGQKMECTISDFPKLKILEFHVLRDLVEWNIVSGAMPYISSLIMERCPKLRMQPDFLEKMKTLRELRIRQMPRVFPECVFDMANMQRLSGNKLLTIYRD